MEKFQEEILKLAESSSNPPLTPAAKAHVKNYLNQVFSHYTTPDHPPYSMMIKRAILELNEKEGSDEKSISEFLQKEYQRLPFAHSTLLKHHLGKLCESGDITITLDNKYVLVEANPCPNSCSESRTKFKPKQIHGVQERKQGQ